MTWWITSIKPRGMTSTATLFFLLSMGVLFVAACQRGNPSIEIDSPQAVISPIVVGSGSVFLNIVNSGRGSDMLIDARINISGTVSELHDMGDGKMKKVDRIIIPSADTVRLRPAGQHIMVYKMPKNIKPGAALSMTLSFEKSGEKSISVPVVDKYERSLGEQH